MNDPANRAFEPASSDGRNARPQGWVDVAILGGGATGVLVAIHLLEQAQSPLRVALWDACGRWGRGWAYGTSWPALRLNVPAAKLGAFARDPEDFYRWASEENGNGAVRPGDFLPRVLYGQYLEQRLREAEDQASARGIFLIKRAARVIDLFRVPGGYCVCLAGGEQWHARFVVLATGLLPPAPLPGSEACSFPLYVNNPWTLQREALEELAARRRLLAVGTGLTFLDVLTLLSSFSFQGVLYGVSPRGLFPLPHRLSVHGVGKGTSQLEPPFPHIKTLRGLREHFAQSVARGIDPRDWVDLIRPSIPELWQGLSLEDRARFLRHLRPYWNVVRHRAPPEDAQLLGSWLHTGRCRLVRARVRRLRPSGGRVEALLEYSGGRQEGLLVDAVINCTGPRFRWQETGDPLWERLFDRRLVGAGPLGLGIATQPDGTVLGPDNEVQEGLFAVGPLRIGDLWETTAIPEIRSQAAALAGWLCEACKASQARMDPSASMG
ncbi:FAD/NAD(P)-binding protein [Candidatus Methylacidithermus pantelleriae]|uniref:Hydroxyacylglutathione hydrolase n=1 Tax=Candidatus Methylacidithermus pantelleriae TaxID=2744239 RepID=A0A8J2BRW3_9BACT|nr:FAD/NAD(P)-binding protein [Candidatus Methylacidithermus pantelleriae]CAF0695018.1 Hydroxyacylglutathione hydrolase [Candidatus Methylacidithermus pantelleriae]